MKKLLVAITYHNQTTATIHKTTQSVLASVAATDWDNSWYVEMILFCHDKTIAKYSCIRTEEESLGGKRNFALHYARANNFDLISFLDDDDLFGPSWLPGLRAAFEENPSAIFHPQWNVIFGPDWYKIHEHMSSNDPRFDSRDCLLNNPWSALCAFDPMKHDIAYRQHLATDKRLSFEDWSFNLDTYCEGIEHIAVKDTFHFLRIRENSLGKKTFRCAPAHTQFFLDETMRNMHLATESCFQERFAIDPDVLTAEMQQIHEIEPLLYFWSQEKIEQEHYGSCAKVSTAIDLLGEFRGVSDVFWTIDHNRTGGAEKALHFAKNVLARFPLGEPPRQLWIDDIAAGKHELQITEWSAALRNVLRAWQDEENSKARSLHICNSFIAWQTLTYNPELFKGIEVYLYVFNDDYRFKSLDEPHTKGFHSPLWRFANMIDRPNFHIVTDSKHFQRRIHDKTGLGEKVRIIQVPVVPQLSRRKKSPTDRVDILWASRIDRWKGTDLLIDTANALDPKKFKIHVWGAGDKEIIGKIEDASVTGAIEYHGAYKSFELITGEYDFFLFTSEREGMPNVAKEARAANLPVMTRFEKWSDEFSPEFLFADHTTGKKLAELIAQNIDHITKEPKTTANYSFEASLPSAMWTYKECLTARRKQW